MAVRLALEGKDFIFSFKLILFSFDGNRFIFKFYDGNKINITQGKKIMPGISSFSENPQGLSTYFSPILMDAAEHIPPESHSKTPVFILGTAGK
jgi:Golgi nucleoside diphosphatase